MRLIEILKNIDRFNEEAFLYAKRVNGRFLSESEVVILELNEEELEWKTNEVTEKKCPGFEYFLEMYLIKDFLNSLNIEEYNSIDKKCARIIYYAENDA